MKEDLDLTYQVNQPTTNYNQEAILPAVPAFLHLLQQKSPPPPPPSPPSPPPPCIQQHKDTRTSEDGTGVGLGIPRYT